MKVSIIVPVYNAEKYLDKCIESIVRQTEREIEIILIDDDSTDKSGNICENWALKDSRIKVFHIENLGVSNARNCGIRYASGQYIMFVDSDDWIRSDMVEILLNSIENGNSQAVFCNYITVKDDQEILCEDVLEYKNYQNEEVLEVVRNMFGGGRYYSSIWRGIYKKEVIEDNHISFRNLKFAEDLVFNLEYLLNCDKVQIMNDELYYYRVNSTSALQSLKNNVVEIQKVPKEIYGIFYKNNKVVMFEEELEREVEITIKRTFDIDNRYSLFKQNILTFSMENIIGKSCKNIIVNLFIKEKWTRLYVYLWMMKIKNYILKK